MANKRRGWLAIEYEWYLTITALAIEFKITKKQVREILRKDPKKIDNIKFWGDKPLCVNYSLTDFTKAYSANQKEEIVYEEEDENYPVEDLVRI